MPTTPTAAALRRLEATAWYALWSAAVCLFTVPAAWAVLPGWGWLPGWLLGAPLLLLALLRAADWARAGGRVDGPCPEGRLAAGGPLRGRNGAGATAPSRSSHAPRGRDLAAACARGPRPPLPCRLSR